ncbi:MAG: GNAT family N-acetyltransferase [Lachnospiraceae bacterium]|nr:GNAT family N-acetyltransferase [Lachnospiraceae bacterium]
MIEIRRAQPTDYEMVQRLEGAVFKIHQQARPDYFHTQSCYTKQEFEELLNLSTPISLMDVCDKKIVGICFGKIEKTEGNSFCKVRKIAVIEDLSILPEYRGQGIASNLIQKAREQAIAENAESLELCVWGFNTDALHLYEKLGMQVQYYRMEQRL